MSQPLKEGVENVFKKFQKFEVHMYLCVAIGAFYIEVKHEHIQLSSYVVLEKEVGFSCRFNHRRNNI